MPKKKNFFDTGNEIIIIGSGPVALTAAFKAIQKKQKVIIISDDLIKKAPNSNNKKIKRENRVEGFGGLAKQWHFQCAILEESDFKNRSRPNNWQLSYNEYINSCREIENLLEIKVPKDNIYLDKIENFKIGKKIKIEQIFTTIAPKRTWDEIFEFVITNDNVKIKKGKVLNFKVKKGKIIEIIFSNKDKLIVSAGSKIFLCAGCLNNTILVNKIYKKSRIKNKSLGIYLTDHPMFKAYEIQKGARSNYKALFVKSNNGHNNLTKRKQRVMINDRTLGVFEIRHFFTKRSINETKKTRSLIEVIKGSVNYISTSMFKCIIFYPLKSEVWIQMAQSNNKLSRINFSSESYHYKLQSRDLINYKKVLNASYIFVQSLGFKSVNYELIDIDLNSFTDLAQCAYHFSGTTRYSDRKFEGVVGDFGKLNDMENIYIFGSSTFPSSSWINPTLTAMAITSFNVASILT
jgi:GMC oxidoreductase